MLTSRPEFPRAAGSAETTCVICKAHSVLVELCPVSNYFTVRHVHRPDAEIL